MTRPVGLLAGSIVDPVEPRQQREQARRAAGADHGHGGGRRAWSQPPPQPHESDAGRRQEPRDHGRLFERTSRQVTLTPLGQELRQRMISAYEQIQQAYLDVREMATGVAGPLRLGIPHLANGYPHLPEIIKVFEARCPGCQVQVTESKFGRDQFDRLRRDELDVLAMCLSVSAPGVVIGPIVSCEDRVLAVAADHPLASCRLVCVEDLADYPTMDIPAFSREVKDAFGPPRTPSGRPISRAAMHSVAEAIVRVAAGDVVHPTVPAIIDWYRHLGIAALPIRDLEPAETALMWLQSRNGPKVQAFAQAAADVVGG